MNIFQKIASLWKAKRSAGNTEPVMVPDYRNTPAKESPPSPVVFAKAQNENDDDDCEPSSHQVRALTELYKHVMHQKMNGEPITIIVQPPQLYNEINYTYRKIDW